MMYRMVLKAHCMVAVMFVLSGCVSIADAVKYEKVKPWERGAFTEDGMQTVLDTMDQSADVHIHFSREASTGGSGAKGGGCGCN